MLTMEAYILFHHDIKPSLVERLFMIGGPCPYALGERPIPGPDRIAAGGPYPGREELGPVPRGLYAVYAAP